MAIGSNTLDVIRQLFRKQDFERPPYIPPVGYQGLSTQQAFFGHGMPSEIQGLSDTLRIDSELVSRFVDYEDQDDAPLCSCLTGDTVVTTVAGQFTLKELSEKYREGEVFPILAFDTKSREFVVADAHHPRKTKTDKIIKVTFDDGTILRCTPDHKILSFDGEWTEASRLFVGQSVMSCKMILNSNGYRELRQPARKTRELIYRLVAKYFYGDFDKKLQVHHVDEDKLNDNPENLQLVTREEHCRIHGPAGTDASKNLEWTEERRKKHALRMHGNKHLLGVKWTAAQHAKIKGRPYQPRACSHVTIDQVLSEVRKSDFINQVAKKLKISWNSVCWILERNGYDYKKELGRDKLNKKVIKIEDAGVEDVYDLTTEKYHNFLANNVVVHNSAFEIFTEDATQTDSEKQVSIWVECEDGDLKTDLDDLLNRRLKMEERVYEDVRTLVKYGNLYAEIVVKENVGVVALNSLMPPSVRRIEVPKEIGHLATPRIDLDADTLGFIYDPRGMFRITTHEFIQELNNRVSGGDSNRQTAEQSREHHVVVFEGWEVMHCRLRGKQPTSPYGFGVGEPARWIFKRLQLLEDSIMMHRITRAPSRFAFYIDVSQIPPSETSGYLNRVKQALKKQKFTNPQTGKFDLKFDPLCLSLDTRIPTLSSVTKTLREMIKDHENGVQNWVYSYDRDRCEIAAGKVVWAGVTRKDAEVVRVTFDNGQQEVMTPDHKVLMRRNEYVCAKDLKPGDSVMVIKRHHSNGREYVHQLGRGTSRNNKWIHTHRMALGSLGVGIDGLDVHHKDNDKFNNNPENLEAISRAEHLRIHGGENGHLATWRKNNPELCRRLLAERNKRCNQKRFLITYNNSEKHSADNAIRSKNLTRLFSERRKEMCEAMTYRFPESMLQWIGEAIKENPMVNSEMIAASFPKSALWAEFFEQNGSRLKNKKKVDRHTISKFIKTKGYSGLRDFKQQTLNNHKVVRVEFLTERQDTGCITVEKYHNFALSSDVVVKNSAADDFFLPVRDGKESTRVESLQGPVYDHIEDIKFFEDKLFAAFRIPRPFLTYENTTAKSHLSAEDARFARSVLRIQREYIQGVKKVCRVHLAARGVNPDTVDFKIKMTIPSAIFELSQLEIRNAELELADKFGAWAPKGWIMRNVLGFSDDEILEMGRLEQIEKEVGVEKPSGGAGGGALERALSKRGTPAIPTPSEPERSAPTPSAAEEQPQLAWRQFKRDQVLMNGRIASERALLDKIEEIRFKNRDFDRKLSETRNLMKEVRDRLR